jgi:hypothetical protein
MFGRSLAKGRRNAYIDGMKNRTPRMTTRLRGLASALLILAAAGPAVAAEQSPQLNWKNPAPVYKDLPGVVPHDSIVRSDENDPGDCTVAIENRRWHRGEPFPDFPVRVYRCEKNGVVYSGTEMPNRPWVPGLNPYDLPKQ